MTVRLCVFDCDGTLVDSQHAISACMGTAFAINGLLRPEQDVVRRVVGLSLLDAVAVLAPDAEPATWQRLAADYAAAFADLRRSGALIDPLYPGVLDGLDAIEATGWLLGMATGKSQRGARATLDGHGLLNRFVTIQTADVAAGKPSPDMVLRAMAETGADAASTAVVGDTVYDMQMARDAGVLAIGVAWGYHAAEELIAAGAGVVVESFADLLPVIEGTRQSRRL
jgi:phosphoglycolate phosphatase